MKFEVHVPDHVLAEAEADDHVAIQQALINYFGKSGGITVSIINEEAKETKENG